MATPIVFDGWQELSGGMDGGISPSLIEPNQCAFAENYSFRRAFPRTRPPWANMLLTFDTDTTESRWTGKFQGAVFYQADFGPSGFVLSRGGKLFRISLGMNNVVSEITPTLTIVTTADFTVPAPAANVLVDVVSDGPFTVGDTVFIDSGQYTVVTKFLNQLLLNYVGGAANAVAVSGNSVLDSVGLPIIEYQTNPATDDFVYLFQAENYVIVLDAPHSTIIYDGFTARKAGIGELPPGVVGTYAWGRIWISLLDRRSFIAGDLIYGPSGTPALGFRDSILKVTENDFLNEGGNFTVPSNAGPINSIQALADMDTSLGIGPILIGTSNSVVSCNAPVDRTTWKNLTYPIQTISLTDYGPLGPRSTVQVNTDMWYRTIDGIRSFIAAKREMNQLGQTAMSMEVSPILSLDTESLLFFGSAINFDNKLYETASPTRTDSGIIHNGFVIINFDEVSNLRGKSPPAWEGVNSGLQIFQVLKGRIDTKERGFIFALNSETLELWEILKDGDGFYDTYQYTQDDNRFIVRTAIKSVLETKSYPFGNPYQPKQLNMGELYIDEIVDSLTLVIKFKPDQYPAWLTWATLNICANVSQCTITAPSGFTCSVWALRQKQYAARITLPQPPESCNTIAGIPVNIGHEFQFRLEQTGHAQIRKFRAHAIPQPQETEGLCPTEQSCKTFEHCDDAIFNFNSHGTAPPPPEGGGIS